MADSINPNLPREPIDWFTKPIARFFRIEAVAGAILLFFTIVALILSNSPWSHVFQEFWEKSAGIQLGSFEFTRSLREWINDGLMTLFFFVVALELKRELVLGELRNPRTAALSIAAAVGGMLVPGLLYFLMQSGQTGQHGWGTVMATDTAFVIGCLALMGSRIPQSLRVFMLSLAIVDDIGAILVVAIGYGTQITWWALVVAAIAVAVVRSMALLGVRNITVYFLLGLLIWIAVDGSGIHATVSGVVLGLMTPTARWVSDTRLHSIMDRVVTHAAGDIGSGNAEDRRTLRMVEAAARESLSPVERLELMLHPWVAFFIMPLFAFANAGVSISLIEFKNPVTIAVFAGFVFGKPIGVFVFSWSAVRIGIATRPSDLTWTLLASGGVLAGIGFTMALFIANLAFSPEQISAAKLGILLASVFSAGLGIAILSAWHVLAKPSLTESAK